MVGCKPSSSARCFVNEPFQRRGRATVDQTSHLQLIDPQISIANSLLDFSLSWGLVLALIHTFLPTLSTVFSHLKLKFNMATMNHSVLYQNPVLATYQPTAPSTWTATFTSFLFQILSQITFSRVIILVLVGINIKNVPFIWHVCI